MTKAEQARRMAWRFKVLQQATAQSRNIARTCRHFGISRQTFYCWQIKWSTCHQHKRCLRSLANESNTSNRSTGLFRIPRGSTHKESTSQAPKSFWRQLRTATGARCSVGTKSPCS
jgi:Helix-turn-helix domain